MNFSTNHNLQVGDIVSTQGRQVAIADEYEVYTEVDGKWQWQKVGDGHPVIRICEKEINTNNIHLIGLVCFLPIWSKGYAILSVKIQTIGNKSVKGIPLEYIETNPPLDGISNGEDADKIFNKYMSNVNNGFRAIWNNKKEIQQQE